MDPTSERMGVKTIMKPLIIARFRGQLMKNRMRNTGETMDKRDVYLLKIYQRSSRPDPSIVGTVEEITGRKKAVFKTGEELLRWLDDQAEQNSFSS